MTFLTRYVESADRGLDALQRVWRHLKDYTLTTVILVLVLPFAIIGALIGRRHA